MKDKYGNLIHIKGTSNGGGDAEAGENNGEDESPFGLDDYGNIDIPDRDKFFLYLSKEGLFAVSSRRNDLTKTKKSVPLAAIKPII